jgi:glutamine amidotransferase
MWRALGYLGPPLPLSALLDAPDNSLIQQAIAPAYLRMLNLAGFGLNAWNTADAEPDEPLVYQSTTVPVYDTNLASLARKLTTTCALAHVRGVAYRPDAGFGPQNLHPFRYRGARLALAHNGDMAGFDRMRVALDEHVHPALRVKLRGTTDSERVYALLLSQLDDPGAWNDGDTVLRALDRTLTLLRRERERAGIDTSSSLNLFTSDGRQQIAVRFTFDFGRYPLDPSQVHDANARFLSLWYTTGQSFDDRDGTYRMRGGDRPQAAIVASEPLTRDTTGWVEVPEYSAVVVSRTASGIGMTTHVLDA